MNAWVFEIRTEHFIKKYYEVLYEHNTFADAQVSTVHVYAYRKSQLHVISALRNSWMCTTKVIDLFHLNFKVTDERLEAISAAGACWDRCSFQYDLISI